MERLKISKFSLFHNFLVGKNRKNIILVPTIAIDVLINIKISDRLVE